MTAVAKELLVSVSARAVLFWFICIFINISFSIITWSQTMYNQYVFNYMVTTPL